MNKWREHFYLISQSYVSISSLIFKTNWYRLILRKFEKVLIEYSAQKLLLNIFTIWHTFQKEACEKHASK